jgi:hypothetical protein
MDAQELIGGAPVTRRDVSYACFVKFDDPPTLAGIVLGGPVSFEIFIVVGGVKRN